MYASKLASNNNMENHTMTIKIKSPISLKSLREGKQFPDRLYYREAVDSRLFRRNGEVITDAEGRFLTADGDTFIQDSPAWDDDCCDVCLKQIPRGWKVKALRADIEDFQSFRIIPVTEGE